MPRSYVLMLAALVTANLTSVSVLADLRPVDLSCEYLKDPLGIDTPRPRLSWRLQSKDRGATQTAWQVVAASTSEKLTAGAADLWDSGRVESGQSIQIEYGGRALTSGQTVFWQVRVWDARGAASPFSDTARFEMGLLSASDWKGQWICDPRPLPENPADLFNDQPAPLFRREFEIQRPVRRARAYVTGLGFYEFQLNGRPVCGRGWAGGPRTSVGPSWDGRVLDPAWTSYGQQVLYSTYDVTSHLTQGRNAAGLLVGNGWYNPLPLKMWGWLNIREHLTVGRPRTILQLNIEYEDGTRESVVTDPSWRVADSPILRNSVYLGEVYDARREKSGWDTAGFDDRDWRKAAPATEPIGRLSAQMIPPIRREGWGDPAAVLAGRPPAKLTQPAPDVFIFDFGQNTTGWVTLRVRGAQPGRQIRLRYGELLNPDGTLNVMTSVCGQIKRAGVGGPGAPDLAAQTDVYICRGGEFEIFKPRFAFRGFRYVEVTGYPGRPQPAALSRHVLHSDLATAGSFRCSDPLLNDIHGLIAPTFLSNLLGVQSDCPHREKFGYGGDIVATSETAMLNFDMAAFYAKTVRDFGDAVRDNSGFTETAPYVGISAFEDGLGGGAAPIGWGTVHPLLLWQMHQYYGDKRLIEEQYPAAKRWLEFLDQQAKDFIIDRGIGDHETLAPKDVPLTSTAFYWWNADLLSRLARVLGRDAEAGRFRQRADQIKTAFNTRFLDPATGRYGKGTQACQSFALYLGLVPDDVRARAFDVLVQDLAAHDDHLTTGIFGTRFTLQVLSDHGRPDLAYRVVSQRDFPGWGHMLARGATTLWEHWEFSDNVYSHNHPMFGSVSEWFVKYLAGIRPADDAVGFDRIIIAPAIVKGLTSAQASYTSIRGRIASEWSVADGQVKLHVEIPPAATATVHLPASDPKTVRESGAPLDQSPGVRFERAGQGRCVCTLPPGQYDFAMPLIDTESQQSSE